ncbi:MAG: thiol-disulfide oxidoreductase DCC family protein [Ignavibacteriae bacterium]|nr:thiol-disulfide oxidoreductase DCC family protein [Ignavibacteriota bacterium]MCB9214925.1 thiol-disulfide oxidoreductase DCC family protein [Ignavibacteria bacterium]
MEKTKKKFDRETSLLVLFDGVCNFCEGSVRFIIDRDPKGLFRFASLQSEFGQSLLQRQGRDPEEMSSVVLVQDDILYTKSAAALRIARRLRFPWPVLFGFIILPPFLRDFVYDYIARNRYKWFGKKEECMIPTPEIRERFLG